MLHVGAILYYFFKKKQNLVRPMLSGDKALGPDVPASTDSVASRSLALLLLCACAASVAWIVSLGD